MQKQNEGNKIKRSIVSLKIKNGLSWYIALIFFSLFIYSLFCWILSNYIKICVSLLILFISNMFSVSYWMDVQCMANLCCLKIINWAYFVLLSIIHTARNLQNKMARIFILKYTKIKVNKIKKKKKLKQGSGTFNVFFCLCNVNCQFWIKL